MERPGTERAALADRQDCCDGMETLRREDPGLEAAGALLRAWHDALGEEAVAAKEVLEESAKEGREPLRDAIQAVAGRRGEVDIKRFGYWLRSLEEPDCRRLGAGACRRGHPRQDAAMEGARGMRPKVAGYGGVWRGIFYPVPDFFFSRAYGLKHTPLYPAIPRKLTLEFDER
jgi:hypothetical protein